MMTHQLILWPFLVGLLCLAVTLYLVLDLTRRHRGSASMVELSRAVRAGSREFLTRQTAVATLVLLLVYGLIGLTGHLRPGTGIDWITGLAFLLGAFLTTLAGHIGMTSAVHANNRTAEAARLGGISSALGVAFSGGAVMGLCVTGFSLIGLSVVLFLYRQSPAHAIFAYALGASLVALLVRVSGGVYTKGSDIGSDHVTRTEPGFSENDTRNAAVVADSVGDNVGNVVGLGANLLDSFTAAIVAAMAIALTLSTAERGVHAGLFYLPLLIGGAGALAALAAIFYVRVAVRESPQRGLMLAVLLAALPTLLAAWALVDWLAVPFTSELRAANGYSKLGIFYSLGMGLVAGAIVGFSSEFYTSFRYRPTRRVSERNQFGAALGLLEGLSVGMRSTALPVLILAATVALAHRQAGYYGVAMAAFGILTIVGLIVTINSFGPIVDNAGGIAEMVRMDRNVRDIMENLHTVSNVTTAMGKGLATHSAAFVALALLLAFIRYSGFDVQSTSIAHPAVLGGLLVGAMFPFYLASILFHGVCSAAASVIDEARRQLREIPGLREGKARPDYARVTELATRRAVRGMALPGALVVGAPIVAGLVFGREALVGFLAGALAGSLAMGFLMVNTGGALDNAKKYIEDGYYGGKGSDAHKAAIAGDHIGDAFKDTIGPVLSISIKTMCIVALLIVPLL